MKFHNCPDREIDGNDADIEIQTNGVAEISYEDYGGMDGCITLKFKVCPFCGVKLDDTEPEVEKVNKDKNHRCINFYHGVCMDCGERDD